MKLSHVLKTLAFSVIMAASMATAGQAATKSAEASKPNILVLLTDDAGMDQLQLYGYSNNLPVPAPETPNLSTLQRAGLTFRNAWTMPACSTARGVLYTGRYPFRTDLYAALGPSDLANSMISPYLKTIPKILSQNGYATGLFGKFHIGLQGNNPYGIAMPSSVGWEYFNGWLDVTGDPSSIDTTAGLGAKGTGQNGKGLYPNGYVPGTMNDLNQPITYGADYGACYTAEGQCTPMQTAPDDKNPAGRQCRDSGGIFDPTEACTKPRPSYINFQTLSAHYVSPLVINDRGRAISVPPTDKRARTFRNVQQTDAAIDWINKQKKRGKPWFATISTATVHTPLQVPPRNTLPAGAPGLNDADVSTQPYTVANQMIQALDYEFGRLLTSTGLAVNEGNRIVLTADAANTVIIYVNDNGSLGSQVRLPFNPSRAKGTSYQTGVWTPMIIAGSKVNPRNQGENVEALVNIADAYELIGNLAGINVRKNNPYKIDSVPMIQYLADNEAPSRRKFDFNIVGPNIQANEGVNGPCQFPGSNPPSCSQIPVTKGVCEDNGGFWFGEGASGTYTTTSATNPNATVSMSVPSSGFKYCCQVQQYIASKGGIAGTVVPTTSMAVRDLVGYKLVRNQWNNYDPNSSTGCQETVENQLYIVGQQNPNLQGAPLLDNIQIPTPYNPAQQAKYNQLTAYMNATLASEPDCLDKGDGNDDGKVDLVDLANYKKMRKLTSKSSWYDVNTDGYTNDADKQIITKNLGLTCPKN